jgi:hypothetical protein
MVRYMSDMCMSMSLGRCRAKRGEGEEEGGERKEREKRGRDVFLRDDARRDPSPGGRRDGLPAVNSYS